MNRKLMKVQGNQSRLIKTTLLLLLPVLFLAGCSAGGLAIRYLYSKLDNNLNQRILSYAEFSVAQESEIKQEVDRFVRWHRGTELPRYADFIDDLVAGVEHGEFDQSLLLEKLEQSRGFFRNSFKSSPMYRSAPFLKRLNDTQVDQIEEKFAAQDEKFLEWFEQRKKDPSREKQIAKIAKTLGRIGLELRADQRAIITAGLQRYQGSPLDRHQTWGRWEARFLELLRARSQASFETSVSQHIALYQDQMRRRFPQRDLANQRNTAAMFVEILQSLDTPQKKKVISRLRQTSGTLRSMAKS